MNSDTSRGVRHYLIDEDSSQVWIVANGRKRNYCDPNEQCHVQFSKSVISGRKDADGYDSGFRIDRVTGDLTETLNTRDQKGNWLATLDLSGQCTPDTELRPRF